jgi:L-asparaginase II
MEAYSGVVLAKVGAEGVYGAALLDRGWGIAVKVEDGHTWAAAVALIAILRGLKLLPDPFVALAGYAQPPVRNIRGLSVGHHRACGDITFVGAD